MNRAISEDCDYKYFNTRFLDTYNRRTKEIQVNTLFKEISKLNRSIVLFIIFILKNDNLYRSYMQENTEYFRRYF